jgi:hypothetical protein
MDSNHPGFFDLVQDGCVIVHSGNLLAAMALDNRSTS